MSIITRNDELEALCERFAKAPYITVDTEFMRERTYWPVLCLLQVSDGGEAHAVDPLAEGLDLAPILRLMNDPAVLKVFHAARQDLEIFHRLTGRVPAPLFDTQLAAMVTGFGDNVGYEPLVNKLANASVDKTSQFTDWSRRPLSQRQVDYALADVIHLRPVYEKLTAKLAENGRAAWLEEEMAILADPSTYVVHPEDAWRRLKVRNRKPRYLGVLKSLATWREREARDNDTTRNRVLRDEAIQELAAEQPTDERGLGRLRTIGREVRKGAKGAAILTAVRAGLDMPESELPHLGPPQRLPRDIGPVVDLLKVLLKFRAERHGVAQRLIATVDELERIAGTDDDGLPALNGWRREVFGEAALALKRGELALAVENRRIKVHELNRRQ